MNADLSKEQKIASLLCLLKRAHKEFERCSIDVKIAEIQFDDPYCSDDIAAGVLRDAREKQFQTQRDFEKIAASFLDTSFSDLIRILTGGDQV